MLSQILGGHQALNPWGGGRRGRWGKREALAFSPQLTLFGLRKSESFVNEL